MTDRELLLANNQKIKEIQETLKDKMLKASGQGEYFVKVIDYDGTILKETNLNTGDTFTLPPPPSHDGLVFQEWSCSQEIVDNTITITDNNVMVGAVYTTASGLNEFDIELTKVTGLDVTLNMDGTKDWGDGTSDDLTTHTYSSYGKYTIKCNGTTMSTTSSVGLFGQKSSQNNYYCTNVRFGNITKINNSLIYCNSLKDVIIPNTVTSFGENLCAYNYSLIVFIVPSSINKIPNGTTRNCESLKYVVIPNGVTEISTYVCISNYSLDVIVIPKTVTKISSYSYSGCVSLREVIIPDTVTTLSSSFEGCRCLKQVIISKNITNPPNRLFYSCSSLEKVALPENVTKISSAMFTYCSSLNKIKIPSKVTLVDSFAFRYCYSIITYDFSMLTSVPTLASRDAFEGINKIAKIIVPDNLYDEWIVATNWSTYANYIYKASEVQ